MLFIYGANATVTGNSNKGLMSIYMPFIQLGSNYGIVKYQKPSYNK